MHAVILISCHNYSSTPRLKHLNDLDKVNKSPYVRLLDMAPHNVQYYNHCTNNYQNGHWSRTEGLKYHH